MASTIELFPAPVGPVIAKRSRASKSSSTCCRKLLKPSTRNLLGRIRHLFIEVVKRAKNSRLWRRSVLSEIKLSKEQVWGQLLSLVFRCGLLPGIFGLHVQGIRKKVPNSVSNS